MVESLVSRAGGGSHLEKLGEGARGGEEASKRRPDRQVRLISRAMATLFSPFLRRQLGSHMWAPGRRSPSGSKSWEATTDVGWGCEMEKG